MGQLPNGIGTEYYYPGCQPSRSHTLCEYSVDVCYHLVWLYRGNNLVCPSGSQHNKMPSEHRRLHQAVIGHSTLHTPQLGISAEPNTSTTIEIRPRFFPLMSTGSGRYPFTVAQGSHPQPNRVHGRSLSRNGPRFLDKLTHSVLTHERAQDRCF